MGSNKETKEFDWSMTFVGKFKIPNADRIFFHAVRFVFTIFLFKKTSDYGYFSRFKQFNYYVTEYVSLKTLSFRERALSGRFMTACPESMNFKMAVANSSSKERMALGFSLHLRAEEAIAKFQREIEDDFNYLHEILAEAKQHFGR